MFIILRFKLASYKQQGIVPVLYLLFTSLFLNITRSPPNWALLYSSGHSIPSMAASQNSQNSSGTIVPDSLNQHLISGHQNSWGTTPTSPLGISSILAVPTPLPGPYQDGREAVSLLSPLHPGVQIVPQPMGALNMAQPN